MTFDIQTLYFTNVAVLFIAAIMALLYWLQHRDQLAVQLWAAATALGGVGTLILGLFGPVPRMEPSVVGNSLIIAGFVLAWESMRRFNERPPAGRRAALLVLGFLVVFGAGWLLGDDLRIRVVIASLAASLCALMATREIGWGEQHDSVSGPLSGRSTTAVIFGIVALDMLIRAVSATFSPPVASDLAFFEEPVQGHTMFAMTIGLVCLSISGLSTMAHERLLQRYERLALTDELTELPNRRFFLEHAGRVAKRIAAGGAPPASVLIMDLDRFSLINERFGHSGGDLALATFAKALRAHVRPTDIVSRYGGEEFCALLVDTSVAEARQIAERLRLAVAALRIDVKGKPMSFTVSLGLAALKNADLAAAIERADAALYRAKHAGRDRVAVADA